MREYNKVVGRTKMALRERYVRDPNGTGTSPTGEDGAYGNQSFQEMKARLHKAIVTRMDLTKLNMLAADRVQAEVTRLAEDLLLAENAALSIIERDRLVSEVQHELFGLGPLEPLLADPTISDILVNSYANIYIEKRGKLQKTSITFKDNEHLMRVIERIVSTVGRRIDQYQPMVGARLADGSRVNAIIPPLAIDGPVLSIRRFGADPLKMHNLIENGALTREIAILFEMCVKARLNIIISGGTGAGKTTLLNALSAYIPPDERIVTIEDSAELQLQQPHIVRLETRPPNIEARGASPQFQRLPEWRGIPLLCRSSSYSSGPELMLAVRSLEDSAPRVFVHDLQNALSNTACNCRRSSRRHPDDVAFNYHISFLF